MGLVKGTCNIPGCDAGLIKAKGLCIKHYTRLQRHGHTNQTRPTDWGQKEKHKLYGSWCWHRRSINVAKFCKEWYDDFWLFVKDVGDRPTKNHVLRVIHRDRPMSATNCQWVEGPGNVGSEEKRLYQKLYMREWSKRNPEKNKGYQLKRYFGITVDEYNAISDEQDGLCAICRKKEITINPKTKKPRDLAVDHDHETGKIRGLLCINCNKGIGHLKDDADLLMTAALYIEKHKEARNGKG